MKVKRCAECGWWPAQHEKTKDSAEMGVCWEWVDPGTTGEKVRLWVSEYAALPFYLCYDLGEWARDIAARITHWGERSRRHG